MLSPKRTKFRKQQRGRLKGKATRGNLIAFGDYAIQAHEAGWITSKQIFELKGVDFATAKRAMNLAAYKLPIKTKFITREISN